MFVFSRFNNCLDQNCQMHKSFQITFVSFDVMDVTVPRRNRFQFVSSVHPAFKDIITPRRNQFYFMSFVHSLMTKQYNALWRFKERPTLYSRSTLKDRFSLLCRMIVSITLQYVLNISVIQCIHFKSSLMYDSS